MSEPAITDITKWEPPQTTGSFAQNFADFLRLARDEQTVKMRAQYLWSYIMLEEQWREARAWIGPDGEVYASESDVPSHLLAVTSYTAQFPTLSDFTAWCEEHIRGFSWTTYRDRHYVVEDLMSRGHDLKTACEYACYSRSIPNLVSKIFVEQERTHEIVSIDEEMVKRLPTLKVSPEEFDELPDKEKVKIAKEAAREYDLEKLAALKEGIRPQIVSAIARREIERKPKIDIIVPYNTPYPYAVECTTWGDEDTGYGSGTVSVVYIQLIDGETGEVLERLPPLMEEWWIKKFGLGLGHGAHKFR